MDVEIIILLSVVLFLTVVQIIITLSSKKSKTLYLNDKEKDEIIKAFSSNVEIISSALKASQDSSSKEVKSNLENMTEKLKDSRDLTEKRLVFIENKLDARLESMRATLERNLLVLQESNQKKLEEIQKTVDEKLTKTLNDRFNESFKVLTEELERVSKTIGEMQKISSEVGVLSKVLSNVKTTGIFGEIQLGAIIDQILSPEQYEKNVIINKDRRESVEFAIKMPGGDDGEVLLPVDSKFPYTVYTDMQFAYENGNFEEFELKKKQLISTVKNMAKDIKEKYVNPPKTTNFAIMFLPIEGLYAEIVKFGLVEELQSKYSVTVAGPTTMSALLNSLQMGFQTLAIQKKSNEVWGILGAVKVEFEKFGGIIESIQKKLNGASNELDQLLGVRTRAIDRKLRGVVAISGSANALDIVDEN